LNDVLIATKTTPIVWGIIERQTYQQEPLSMIRGRLTLPNYTTLLEKQNATPVCLGVALVK
jgi:hypothetical protein